MNRKFLSLALALFVAACNDTSGTGNNNPDLLGGGNNGGGNFSVVSRSSTVDVGSTDCPNGGVRVQIGLDDGSGTGAVARDGTLQDSEVDKTEFICNSAPTTFATLTLLTPLPIGNVDCPFGGSRVDYGLDNGDGGATANNGTLETTEIDGHTNACLAPPDNLLVITTPLFPGDPACPYGGQTITSGFDDGKPTGTANNGQLETDEIDLTTTQCNPPPADTFPNPGGTVGTAFINSSGGDGVGPGSGSSSAGNPGDVEIGAYGAQLATTVELHKAGTVTAPVAPAPPAFDAGANPVLYTSTPSLPIPVFTTKQATGAYVYRDTDTTEPNAYPKLYNGMNPATSLRIGTGATVTFAADLGEVRLAVDGDIWIEGTFKAEDQGDGNYPVFVQARHVLVDTNGAIDLRGDTSAHYFELWAVFGGEGTIYNKGRIDTSGLDEIPDGRNVTNSANMNLIAVGNISNSGKLLAKGAVASSYQTSGSNVFVRTLKGDLFTSGEIDVSGATSDGGSMAGNIYLFNGERYPDVGPNYHPILDDASIYGPGSFSGSGSLVAKGGDSDVDYNSAGQGGEVVIRFVGGAIRSSAYIDTRGGSITVPPSFSSPSGGSGGAVTIAAFTWAGVDGTAPPVVPAGIFLGAPPSATSATQGSIDTRGGDAPFGGSGGPIDIFLNVSNVSNSRLIIDRVDFAGPSAQQWNYGNRFPLGQLDGRTETPTIHLLGYGGGLTAQGGASEFYPTPGGHVSVYNAVCPYLSESYGCTLPFIGSRLISTDLTIDATGGAGTQQYGGANGGRIDIEMDEGGNGNNEGPSPAVSYQPTQVIVAGLLDVSGPNNDTANSWYDYQPNGGNISVNSNVGQLDVNGELRARGATQQSDGYYHGGGGNIGIDGVFIDLRGLIDARAGGDALSRGFAGYISVDGYRVTNQASGTLDNSGQFAESGIYLYGTSSVINLGNILSTGTGYYVTEGPTSQGNGGGYVQIQGGGSAVNNGTINVKGATFTTGTKSIGGQGGTIFVSTSSFSNAGVLDASGGSCTTTGSADGGAGGSITVNSPGGTIAGTVRVDGGNATSDNAYGGGGGGIKLNNNNMTLLSGTGGLATGPATGGTGEVIGGYGAEIYVGGVNAGNIDAGGGNATGTGTPVQGGGGGYIELGGTNSACLDVSGGTGTTPGSTGTLVLGTATNMCGM